MQTDWNARTGRLPDRFPGGMPTVGQDGGALAAAAPPGAASPAGAG